jgi:hypothetical protein
MSVSILERHETSDAFREQRIIKCGFDLGKANNAKYFRVTYIDEVNINHFKWSNIRINNIVVSINDQNLENMSVENICNFIENERTINTVIHLTNGQLNSFYRRKSRIVNPERYQQELAFKRHQRYQQGLTNRRHQFKSSNLLCEIKSNNVNTTKYGNNSDGLSQGFNHASPLKSSQSKPSLFEFKPIQSKPSLFETVTPSPVVVNFNNLFDEFLFNINHYDCSRFRKYLLL